MIVLLIALVWLASLGLFVALRAKATKSRLERRAAEQRTDVPRSALGRDAVPLGF
jgi:hypothetical protein